jgi:hypothetical protein
MEALLLFGKNTVRNSKGRIGLIYLFSVKDRFPITAFQFPDLFL